MTFNASHVFSSFLNDSQTSTAYNLGTNSFKLALFGNSTDSATAALDTLAHNTYNAAGGNFLQGNGTGTSLTNAEVYGTNWAAGGIALASPTASFAASGTALFNWTVANTSTASVTISTAFYGALIYDTTVSSRGICMVYFGGSFTVGGGTLAVNWGNNPNAAASVFYITV